MALDFGESFEPEEIIEAALLGRSHQATVLQGKGQPLGPRRVSPDDATILWVRGEEWIARVDEPLKAASDEPKGDPKAARTVKLDIVLAERRVRFLHKGKPLAERELQLQVLPMLFHMRPKAGRCKTDAEGWTTLKMGVLPEGATYSFSIHQALKPDERHVFAKVPWSGE